MATARHGKRSSGLKIELSGTLAAKDALKKRFNKAEDALGDEIMKAAINTANIARKSIQRGSKTGITYEK